jgi:FKBP-type peptidyl-prolyl cis-trans isomerase SlyD
MQIVNERVVLFDYVLRDESGQTLDSSDGREPLAYLHGSGMIIPGLEREMEGKKAGDEFVVQVIPEDAYGIRDEALLQEVPRSQFADADDIEVGMQFEIDAEEGPSIITVVNVDEDTITVDGNHQLAGMNLTFSIVIRDVREASEEELEHGHAHGPGGSHH